MKALLKWMAAAICLIALALLTGCDGGTAATGTATVPTQVTQTTPTVPATPTQTVPRGIQLDPNLQSGTGTPTPEEMKVLVSLQSEVPYPVYVPTWLPGSGYRLEGDLVGSSKPTANDPVGYYSFRYSDPANPNRILTFNQSRANSKPLSGYYITDATINGILFQVYWHKTLEYLPNGDPVRAATVGDAETYVIVWRSQYVDAAGQPQDLYYSISTGTWTGHGWGEIQSMLAALRPLNGLG